MAYKILWYSLPSLLDSSSGAAIRCKLMLEKLTEQDIEVVVLNAAITDDVQGMSTLNAIKEQLQPSVEVGGQKCFYHVNIGKLTYFVHASKSCEVDDFTNAEQSQIFLMFAHLLEQFQPDLLMTYSADIFSSAIRSEAKARGISVVYALCNGSHMSFGFNDCDMVFTTSKATSDLYAQQTGVKVEHVGNFIEASQVVAPIEVRDPKYITLINPSPSKGLAIFIKLVLSYHHKHPEQRFLIVKSRSKYEQNLCALHYADGTPLVDAKRHNPVPMIDVAEHTQNIANVYALTKVLVAPSLWHESWGRVVTEANFNGIPVLATDNGGLYEAMGNGLGGKCLPIPLSCQNDYWCLPTDEEIAPYVEALEHLVNTDYSQACAQATQINSIASSVARLYKLLEPLLKQGAANKNPSGNSYYHNKIYLKNHNNS